MQFTYAYRSHSQVEDRPGQTNVSFAPDIRRSPTFFVGDVGQKLAFREAISALHDVVVSDLRFKPRDRSDYKQWAAQREWIDWQLVAEQRDEVRTRLQQLQTELQALQARSLERRGPYLQARKRFFSYLYEKERNLWFILDPVITVHPDEVFFEAFSEDESSYGRLGASYDMFERVHQFQCGTTNIDYSAALYNEFLKIRSYKATRLTVDPSGFEVQTTRSSDYREVKIDLPDSWVRGFLQVSSAMSLPATRFDLHPMDVYNICQMLRRHREKRGPRSLRYHLQPGEPIRLVFEPWETSVVCGRSRYPGSTAQVIRVWGRRRLLILERLLPLARRFTVHLLGSGMPSFYVADLGPMSFTLGLSGWTTNDWATAGNFDLLAPRANVDQATASRVFDALKRDWLATPEHLTSSLQLDQAVVLGALSAWTQAGKAVFDLHKNVWRARELSTDPLPLDQLRFANEREASATRLLADRGVTISESRSDGEGTLQLQGQVKDKKNTFHPWLAIDRDERMTGGECTCYWHRQHELRQGPCEHLLALRMQSARERRPRFN